MDKISGNILGLTQQKIIFEDPKSSSMLELFFMYKLSAPRIFFYQYHMMRFLIVYHLI